MTKQKGIIYSVISLVTFVGELAFLLIAVTNSSWIYFAGVGAFYLVQAIVGGLMFIEAVFKQGSEGHWVTMGTFMLIPFCQPMSSYFLYRVCKGE